MTMISDEVWDVIESVLPSDVDRAGRRWAAHRMVLEGILWRYRVGAPWRDLPTDFGPWQTVWKRHHRWSFDGTYDRIFLAVQGVYGRCEGSDDAIKVLLSVDSTNVRCHQHGAGARADVMTAAALKKGRTELHGSPSRT